MSVDRLSVAQLRGIDGRFEDDVRACFDYDRAVELKDAEGGTSRRSVLEQVRLIREVLGAGPV